MYSSSPGIRSRIDSWLPRLATLGAACCLLGPALVVADRRPERGGAPGAGLRSVWTGPHAELRETVPIAKRRGAKPRSVLSVELPELRGGDRVRFDAEVTATTTCVERLPRCIGDPYRFDPHISARVVLARSRAAKGAATRRLSAPARITCEQARPNRNHHCPLIISASHKIRRLSQLPCPPTDCRLNMLLAAHHRKRTGGEVIVVGADRPDGSVEGGKARISAVVAGPGAAIEATDSATSRRRARTLPASGALRVIYSQRLHRLAPGDVLRVSARHRTGITRLPYFVATKIVIANRRDAARSGRRVRAAIPRRGTATETNGFNCTLGPSAFSDPCLTRKVGQATVKRGAGEALPTPLFANVVARVLPKPVQARRTYPPARVLRGGELRVTRLRVP